jgi:predicted glycoside hydrolase/deacetylase ChbG (UPF0249 family)
LPATARYLVVTADDFGIGPATTAGILDLAATGRVTASVLLVNSPYAADSVRFWQSQGRRPELGWHPCLTLDRPVAPERLVPSLIGPDGGFWRLGAFIPKLLSGELSVPEIEIELRAQYAACRDLLGYPPAVVNFHHHLQVFPSLGRILRDILDQQAVRPYLRRVRETWPMIAVIPGARAKRLFLSTLGRREYRRQKRAGFPGNEWLAGITNPALVSDPAFLARWLRQVPGQVVELTCHPGYEDATLVGRDCTANDGQLQRRVSELRLLQSNSFLEECERAGFRLVSPAELRNHSNLSTHAA